MVTNHQQLQPSVKFAQLMRELMSQAHSFAACVRVEYPLIEEAISAGVPLAAIARSISETHNVRGGTTALKSALARIRKLVDGAQAGKWLNKNAPVRARPENGANGAMSSEASNHSGKTEPERQQNLSQAQFRHTVDDYDAASMGMRYSAQTGAAYSDMAQIQTNIPAPVFTGSASQYKTPI
ncbi:MULTISPECIES: hypothetical protein [Pandoraea]|uniref:hypothetical protein n=1 Tax=Pandoraea TaxID=93217 RepID=UPI0003C73B19|nr:MULTISPECIES: hypothetical protein [Pandoraea]AHB08268.1 hypothetical protein U875_04960 [Pandoraea pnomenusa 3kgm]AHB78381.1 hypothetical protein X636_04475 [Pandoraea pnomenusa]AHN77605.1 hypothetical protein DA70_22035 [Pandoraea pnomenusa]